MPIPVKLKMRLHEIYVSVYTAHKKFMKGFACREFHLYGAIMSTGRCQKTIVCKLAK